MMRREPHLPHTSSPLNRYVLDCAGRFSPPKQDAVNFLPLAEILTCAPSHNNSGTMRHSGTPARFHWSGGLCLLTCGLSPDFEFSQCGSRLALRDTARFEAFRGSRTGTTPAWN